MAGRTILVQSKAHVCIRDGMLRLQTEGRNISVPLEEIWVVIVESHQTTLTAACLSALCDAGIGLMLCGDDHMPNGLMLPIGAHSRHAEIVEDQLAISKPLKKQLWKRIVQSKIENQAMALDLLGLPSKRVACFGREVASGDTTNREGAAALEYFNILLSGAGRRTSYQSSALDYGYGVLRAGIGRAAVGGGWLVSRGIHHHSIYNAFNLVDDLIEPFRPLVDLLVMKNELHDPLDREQKQLLAQVFEFVMVEDEKRCSCQQCIETTLSSLRTAVLEKDAGRLLLPRLVGLETVPVQ